MLAGGGVPPEAKQKKRSASRIPRIVGSIHLFVVARLRFQLFAVIYPLLLETAHSSSPWSHFFNAINSEGKSKSERGGGSVNHRTYVRLKAISTNLNI